MERTKHKILTVSAVLLCATFGIATAIAALTSSGGVMARAERSTTALVTVDEIYDDDAQSFDSTKIMDLIEKLIGVRSYDTLKTTVGDTKTPKASADFREANGGKNVSVYFGGMKWDAVYLTTAQNSGGGTTKGDIILDLWRSSDTLTSSDTAVYSHYWSDKSPDKDYPSNMYSTSFIRVKALNAGGQYSKSGNTLSGSQTQNSGNQYARFTMSKGQGVENSLTEYLAKPSEVGYQATEYDEETMKSFYGSSSYESTTYNYFPNDAYGELSGGAWYKDGSIDMSKYSAKGSGETAYGAWKDDYLWLPSLTETGMSNGSAGGVGDGMWDTDASLRSAKSGVGKDYCWLRSGEAYRADRAYLLDASGNRNNLIVSNSSTLDGCGVRPALHLNLTAAVRSAIPDKDRWQDDTKPYSPDSVTWKIENTDMVEITAVPKDGGDTSWYDETKHTITAKKVGQYQIQVKPSAGFTWKDDSDGEITVTYTVEPADMTVTFNNGQSGAFNNGRLEQKREFVYSLGMDPIALKLPDPTDSKFPINWKGVAWYRETISKLKIQYIVQKYEETEYDEGTINSYLDGLQKGDHAEEWKDHDELTDKTAQAPKYYVVYFKATDTEGNHNPCYGYFEIHITAEELTITLSEAAKAGFAKGVEYGDVAHTKGDFEQDILGGIQKVIGKLNTDKTKEFKDNIQDYTFYLRKDNSIEGGIVQDDGDIYTVEEDGILHKNGSRSETVDNLPLGTYHLYVDAADKNTSNYLTFAWADDRPSFKVSAREIKVTLTFEEGATYGETHTGWVTATASRAEGADEAWYAQNEATGNDDLRILGLSYTLQGTSAAPNETTPAGTYTVTPTWTNKNYDVQFADAEGGSTLTFIIHKATYDMSAVKFESETHPYDGEAHSLTVEGLPVGVNVTYSGNDCIEVGEHTVTATFTVDERNYEEVVPDSLVATLTIIKATYNMASVTFKDKTFKYDGNAHSLAVEGLPEGVSVKYAGNERTNVGVYEVLAMFTGDTTHYEPISPMTATLTIEDSGRGLQGITFEGETVTYDGGAHSIFIKGTPAEGIFVTYENNGQTEPGAYSVTATFADDAGEFAKMTATLTIIKAKYDMSDVTFGNKSFKYDGTAHEILLEGDLPDGVLVAYFGNGRTEVGEYPVTATFTTEDTDHYELIAPMSATLTITVRRIAFSVEPVSGADGTVNAVFKDEEGNAVTLGADDFDLTYSFNGSAVESMTKAGEYTITVTLKGGAVQNNELANTTAVYTLTQDITGGTGEQNPGPSGGETDPGPSEEKPDADEKSDFDFGMVVVLMVVAIVLLAIVLGLAIWRRKSEKRSNINSNVKEKK